MKPRTTLFALCLATLATLGACTNDDAPETDGSAGGNTIAIVPTLAAPTWAGNGIGTRTEQHPPIAFEPGGKIIIKMYQTDPTDYQQNTFTIDANRKMVRTAYVPGSGDNEGDLCVKAAGKYHFAVSGEAVCVLNYNATSVPMTVSLAHPGATEVDVAADGKVLLNVSLASAGITLALFAPNGLDNYTGGDASALLDPAVKDIDDRSITTPITIDRQAFSTAAWCNLKPQSISQGAEVMRLTVGLAPAAVTTYKVMAPKSFSLQAGRLANFRVRVGTSSISVSTTNGGVVTDFVVQPTTNAEAERPGTYNGVQSQKIAIAGATAYYVAPVNAATGIVWTDVNATLCPKGWHVPTKDDYKAMMGITGDSDSAIAHLATFIAVFGSANFWSSTEESGSKAWILCCRNTPVGAEALELRTYEKTWPQDVRCVQKAE